MTNFEAVEKFKQCMELKGFAPSTRKAYLMHINHFSRYFEIPYEDMSYEHVRDFLLDAIKRRKLSTEYVNSCYSAIKFLYETILQRDWNMKHIPRVKKKQKLPCVLSMDEVKAILDQVQNLKHKAMLTTIYSAGLRVSEAAKLKICDIDSKNMQIFIRQGKGNKDRYAILSKTTLDTLREYYKVYKPKEWLFPGQDPSLPITPRTIQSVFNEAKSKAGITKAATTHTLRHSFATHLIENKTHILKVKELLGHDSLNTTILYIHLARKDVFNIVSPMDIIGGPSNE